MMTSERFAKMRSLRNASLARLVRENFGHVLQIWKQQHMFGSCLRVDLMS